MKKAKCIVSAVLAGAMLLPLTGCLKKVEYVKEKDFKNAIEEVFDEDDYIAHDDFIYLYDDEYSIALISYDDEDDAEDEWDDVLDSYDDMMDDNDFDGRTLRVDMPSYGYIILNGDVDDPDFMNGRGYVYGGIYYVDDEIIVVCTTRDRDSTRDDIDIILRELGLPHP